MLETNLIGNNNHYLEKQQKNLQNATLFVGESHATQVSKKDIVTEYRHHKMTRTVPILCRRCQEKFPAKR